MIRRIIQIDQDLCNGCGACAAACHEGAIAMVDGKAQLMRDDYCDGLGDCLPACPTGAITFVEREAAAYDEAAVKKHMEARKAAGTGAEAGTDAKTAARTSAPAAASGGCPGSAARALERHSYQQGSGMGTEDPGVRTEGPGVQPQLQSQLRQWPVQIKLAPIRAPYFDGAKLLIAADCTAYAYANFHNDFIRDKITLVGCPKLDGVDYSENLTEIIRQNDIRGITIVRMEVPCCGGLEHAAVTALKNSGKFLPWQVVTISVDGKILD